MEERGKRLAYPLTIFSSSTSLARWPKPNSLKYLPGKHLEKRQSLGIGSGALCSTNWANTVSKLKGTRAKKMCVWTRPKRFQVGKVKGKRAGEIKKEKHSRLWRCLA